MASASKLKSVVQPFGFARCLQTSGANIIQEHHFVTNKMIMLACNSLFNKHVNLCTHDIRSSTLSSFNISDLTARLLSVKFALEQTHKHGYNNDYKKVISDLAIIE